MLGGRGWGRPRKEEIETKIRKGKGMNLSKTRNPGPRGPTIPASSFLSLERWTRQSAAIDREVWANRQTAEGEGGAGRKTGKQRNKQTKS